MKYRKVARAFNLAQFLVRETKLSNGKIQEQTAASTGVVVDGRTIAGMLRTKRGLRCAA